MSYRVGCVPYLNAVPLVARLPESVEVVYDVPSALPPLLESGEVSAILVSSIEALRRPGAYIAGGASISSQAEVMSVRLFSRVPIQEIRSLALDRSSMTSNLLAQIVLQDRYGIRPQTASEPPDLGDMLDRHDAGILIGDNGMRASGEGLRVLDLGSEWYLMTSLPFVWAVWLGSESFPHALAGILEKARNEGVQDVKTLIPGAVDRFGFSPEQTERYLTHVMDYGFDAQHRAGLVEFGRRAQALGLVDHAESPAVIVAYD